MSAPMLAFKGVAVDEGNDSQVVDINEAEGIVTAVVSVTGTKDDVDDVIMPGAYAETLKARNPKVCWHHSWEKPIGRVLHIEELMPGDRRLPTKQRNGQPWPKEAGALIATMQFNLKSQRGKEAFEAVVFYSETGECEWSIGYQVQTGKAHRDKQGVRYIKAIDLFELSFVLFGAHNMTGTLALKAAAMLMQMHANGKTKAADGDVVVIRWEEFEQAIKALTPDNEQVPADGPEDVVTGEQESADQQPPADAPVTDTPVTDAPAATDAPVDEEDDGIPAFVNDELDDQGELVSEDDIEDPDVPIEPSPTAELAAAKTLDAARLTIKANSYAVRLDRDTHAVPELPASFLKMELTPLGEVKDTNPGDQSQGARELIHWYEHGEGAAKIRWGEDGDFGRCVKIAEKHMTPEQAKGFCSNRHKGALGVRPGQEKAYGADVDPLDTAPPANEEEPEHTGVMVAVYPGEDAAKQIAVRGGDDPEELHVTLAYLGDMTDEAGGGLTLEDVTPQIVAACQIAAATNQPLTGSIGGLGKFPDSGDGVPVWAPVDVVGLSALREAVVTALTDAGLPVKTDHGFVPHMTVGWNLDMSLIQPIEDVAVTFDKLCVAVGDTRVEVPLGGDPEIPSSGAPVAGAPDLNPPLNGGQKAAAYDPAIETGPDAGHKPAISQQVKMFPYLEGTYEERQRALEQALNEALLPDPEDMDRSGLASAPYLSIDGTWPDRVVCTVHEWAGPGPSEQQSFEVPYTYAPDGSIQLGEPEKVKLTVVAVDDEGNDLPDDVPVGDLLPLAEMIETVSGGLKSVTGGMQVKAGRVLSAANAQRLVSAVEHLISVLAAAGMQVGDPTETPAGRVDPTVDTETTAPSARDAGSKTLVAADVASTLADLSAALED